MRASAGRGGACVMRSRSTAIGITPVGAKPRASSSCRLKSESPSARSTWPTSVASSWRPSVASRYIFGVVAGEEVRRRDVVVLQHPRAGQRRERGGHRRGQREMEDRDVAAPAAGSANGRTSCRRSSSIVIAKSSDSMPLGAQQVADAPGAVADRIALVRGRHPLVHAQGQGIKGKGSESGNADRESRESENKTRRDRTVKSYSVISIDSVDSSTD